MAAVKLEEELAKFICGMQYPTEGYINACMAVWNEHYGNAFAQRVKVLIDFGMAKRKKRERQ
jgi:hypothetical protein